MTDSGPDAESSVGTADHWNLGPVVEGLRDARERWREAHRSEREWGGRGLPSREAMRRVVTGPVRRPVPALGASGGRDYVA